MEWLEKGKRSVCRKEVEFYLRDMKPKRAGRLGSFQPTLSGQEQLFHDYSQTKPKWVSQLGR